MIDGIARQELTNQHTTGSDDSILSSQVKNFSKARKKVNVYIVTHKEDLQVAFDY